jgi:hypothetical protein
MNTFLYKAIFVGLLFSHFFYGVYYSKRNAIQLKQNKVALILAIAILILGLYFSFYMIAVAPYFLVFHSALSDAYLLPIKAKQKNDELLKLLRCLLYIICFGLLFIPFNAVWVVSLSIIGVANLIGVVLLSEERKALAFFEIPLLAIVVYTKLNNITLGIFVLGFYHILTWYAFSFWMLFIKEKNIKKGSLFFGKIALLSVVFVVLFSLLNFSITDVSFAKIIGFWSILHISTSLFLSKFNPQFIKNIFYTTKQIV